MIRQPSKYKYSQLETYKESLELLHLKRKTIIVNMIIILMAIIVGYFLITIDAGVTQIVTGISMFIGLLVVNLAFFSYDDDHYNSLKISMYITTLGVYSISLVLIFLYPTPSVFTSLFLAYAITSIYQDYKSMLLSNFALYMSGTILLIRFQDVFEITGQENPQIVLLIIFLTIFVSLLTLSSYILIKRKNFFYNQLAHIKESEIRNVELYYEIDQIKTGKSVDSDEYYKTLLLFSEELSKKIGIENVFTRKIMLLQDLKKLNMNEINEKYIEYTPHEIERLSLMEMELHKKMRMIGLKSSQSFGVEVTKKEIFSETQFRSFKHFGDHRYVKIISFVVFYCLLKIDKPYLKGLDEEKIKDILMNSEYFYRVDRDILKIYLDNNDVFDAIVKDHLEGSW